MRQLLEFFFPKTATPDQVRKPVTRKGAHGLLYRAFNSAHYTTYRNPAREHRRRCGWPSGRQWRLMRKDARRVERGWA